MGSDDKNQDSIPPAYFGGLQVFGDAQPAHQVILDAFCIDRYEVTVERYEACVRAGACDPGEFECSFMPNAREYQTRVNHYPEECQDRGELCPHHPVNCKSYEQAQDYCQWIGRRLCTEAEWERAASGPGPRKRVLPWGGRTIAAAQANTAQAGPGHLMPVDACASGASAEGIYNLAGNVYEWVFDFYAPYQVPDGGIVANPQGPEAGELRVGRGGCFLSESGHTSAERTTFDPEFNWGCVGIRCCALPLEDRQAGRTHP